MGVIGPIRSPLTTRRAFLLGAAASTGLTAIRAHRALATQSLSNDVRALTTAYNASGHRLLGELASEAGNIALSPYSIGAAMAMALAGASGATQADARVSLCPSRPALMARRPIFG